MALTYDEVRRHALSLPGVVEGNSYGGPSLHVVRKFLGRLREDGETFVLRVDREKREELLVTFPDVFSLTDHYREHPLVLVNLLSVDQKMLAPLVKSAWRSLSSRRVLRITTATRPHSTARE